MLRLCWVKCYILVLFSECWHLLISWEYGKQIFCFIFVAFRRRVRNSKNSAVTFKITHCWYTRYYYLKSTLLTSDLNSWHVLLVSTINLIKHGEELAKIKPCFVLLSPPSLKTETQGWWKRQKARRSRHHEQDPVRALRYSPCSLGLVCIYLHTVFWNMVMLSCPRSKIREKPQE